MTRLPTNREIPMKGKDVIIRRNNNSRKWKNDKVLSDKKYEKIYNIVMRKSPWKKGNGIDDNKIQIIPVLANSKSSK